eukprot:Rmarinus@m.14643
MADLSSSPSAENVKHISYENYDDECVICLEPFTADAPAVVTACGHNFHLHCVTDWVYHLEFKHQAPKCPSCWQALRLPGVDIDVDDAFWEGREAQSPGRRNISGVDLPLDVLLLLENAGISPGELFAPNGRGAVRRVPRRQSRDRRSHRPSHAGPQHPEDHGTGASSSAGIGRTGGDHDQDPLKKARDSVQKTAQVVGEKLRGFGHVLGSGLAKMFSPTHHHHHHHGSPSRYAPGEVSAEGSFSGSGSRSAGSSPVPLLPTRSTQRTRSASEPVPMATYTVSPSPSPSPPPAGKPPTSSCSPPPFPPLTTGTSGCSPSPAAPVQSPAPAAAPSPSPDPAPTVAPELYSHPSPLGQSGASGATSGSTRPSAREVSDSDPFAALEPLGP